MEFNKFTIGFVRRGFSPGGGAESYLKRLARGVVEKGYTVRLYTAAKLSPDDWSFGRVARLEAKAPMAFANEIEKLEARASRRPSIAESNCDVLLSLERIWRADVYRAGDGVHRAWLQRRSQLGGLLQQFSNLLNRKHAAALALEESLFSNTGAGRVIANSKMVRDEIVQFYGFPKEKIDLIYNGVPIAAFQSNQERRAKTRATLGLGNEDCAILFAGTGWERKGLRFAINAIESSGRELRLLVAGRGDYKDFRSDRVKFLEIVDDMPALYGAADIFLLPTIYDPFSNACLEALASGLPIVTTRANGFAEIIESDVHGSILEDPRDTNAIREALQFWSDRTQRERVRTENVALARQFDISSNVDRTLEILMRTAA